MAVNLIVHENSYVTRAAATQYLSESSRTNLNWAKVGGTDKDRALIAAFRLLDKQKWQGDISAKLNVATVTVNAGGTGYSVDDVLTLASGTSNVAATAKVLTLSGSAVATVQLLNAGLYTVAPDASGGATTVAPSGGTGCTLDATTVAQQGDFPRSSLTDRQGVALSADVPPTDIERAQIELAYLLSQDTSQEESGGQGQDKRRVKAGSVEVEFFRPSGGPNGVGGLRFPPVIYEYLTPYLSGGSLPIGLLGGDSETTQFDNDSRYGLSEGFA